MCWARAKELCGYDAAMQSILIIDDDEKLCLVLEEYLGKFNFHSTAVNHPKDAYSLIQSEPFAAIILDIMLPEEDGFQVCKKIRQQSQVPIIMLTARGELTDKVVGLEVGADDYLPKPFEPRELVARLQSLIRRHRIQPETQEQSQFLDLVIDWQTRQVTFKGKPLELTAMEFELLKLMAGQQGKILSRDEILNHLKGIETEILTRSVDILVSRLRAKLQQDKQASTYIKTVWGRGYCFLGK